MDIKIHKQICEINESPVFLKLNPQARHTDVSNYKAQIEFGTFVYILVYQIQFHWSLVSKRKRNNITFLLYPQMKIHNG